jgi:hypothetical protein
MTSAHETGAAIASMSKQLQAVVAEAMKAESRVDPLDEVRAKRERRLGVAG